MTIKESQQKIIEDFSEMQNWEDKYAYIIKLGRELPQMDEELKTDKNKLDGCQSQVWIKADLIDGKLKLQADSDAMIVKGLIAIVVKAYSGHTPEEILSTPPDFIKEIGIDNHLSPTRKNGLGAMLKQIQMFAFAFKAMQHK